MGSYSEANRRKIYNAQNGLCMYCGEPLGDDFEVHAILPPGDGFDPHKNPHLGQALCQDCHEKTLTMRKGWKGLQDYYG